MTLPTSWTLVEVTGRMLTLDGRPRVGTIAFQTTQPTVIEGDVVPNATLIARLDDTGSFSIVLPSTDDPDVQPTGWTYRVTEFLPRATTPRELFVPGDMASVDYAALLELPTRVNADRTQSIVTSNQIVADAARYDVVAVTRLSEDLHIANPVNPIELARILYRITDDGTPRGLTFGDKFHEAPATLPLTTVPGRNIYIATVYDAIAQRWDVLTAV